MIDRSSIRVLRRFWSLALALAGVWAIASGALAEERLARSPELRLKSDVTFLADDAREGRAPGTEGIESAAEYIANVFKDASLAQLPGTEGYFQPFTILGDPKLIGTPTLSFQGPGDRTTSASKDDFNPLAIGTGGTLVNVPVVFVGYGITAKDDSKKLDYDDYAGSDVKGKAVILIRHEPRQDQADSPFDGKKDSRFAYLQHKATNAFQHGAVAVLLVNDQVSLHGGDDDRLRFRMGGATPFSQIPFLTVSRALMDRVLLETGQPTLADLETQIDDDLKPRTRALNGVTLNAQVEIERAPIKTRNVIGVLEGSGPLASQTVIVGAHYDHVGRGGPASGSLSPNSKDIHNGADDNASGTAMMLEMARRLARRGDPLPRRVVFVAFSGEERGLLGSHHYVDHPLVPLADTVMMINFDMVGRLNDKDELTVYGTGTSLGIDALVDALGKSEGFAVKKIADGMGPSDQQSFYEKNIPVLFAFTGTHSDYHRPSDDTDRINFQGMSRIADLSELLLLDLARRPRKPEFVKVVNTSGHGGDPGRVSISAYLGSIPDYGGEVKGVKLNGVRSGSPAEKGGLKGGDVIVKFAGKAIGTIYDYTESLARQKPGDTVEVVVIRDGNETPLSVTLGKKPNE